jgi:hypothetical protein
LALLAVLIAIRTDAAGGPEEQPDRDAQSEPSAEEKREPVAGGHAAPPGCFCNCSSAAAVTRIHESMRGVSFPCFQRVHVE